MFVVLGSDMDFISYMQTKASVEMNGVKGEKFFFLQTINCACF
jgi:hypothetical protein